MAELFEITEGMRATFNEYYSNDAETLQKVLLVLKSQGITQMQSVRLLMEEMDLSLAEADNIVLNSKAWQDEREQNINFREDFFKSLYDEIVKDN